MQSLHKKSGVSTLTNFVVFSVKVWPQPNLSSFNAIPTPPGFVISSNLTSNFPLKAVLILWTPLCYCPIMLIDMQKRTSSLALNVVLSRTNICTPEHSPSQASLVFLSVLSLYSTDFALNTVLTLPMLLLPSLYSTKALLLLKYFPNKWIYFNRCVLLSKRVLPESKLAFSSEQSTPLKRDYVFHWSKCAFNRFSSHNVLNLP